jgi:hypothetical protein
MSLAKKLLSPFRNAFSYAVHLESADDHARKPEAAAKLLAASLPAPEGADAGYEARLTDVLMRTRTKHLDMLSASEVRVVLDTRLPQQKLEYGDRRIDGIFYDTPGAKMVALWDDGTAEKSSWLRETPAVHASTMLEKLAQALKDGIKGDMYASRFTTVDAAPGVGIASTLTLTEWKRPALFEPGAMQKNPALREPLTKQPAAPKP